MAMHAKAKYFKSIYDLSDYLHLQADLNSMVAEKGHPPVPPTKGATGGRAVFLAAA